MEIFIVLVIGIVAYLYFANNRKSVEDTTVIETKRTVKIDGGEQTITRRTVINDVKTDIRTPSEPISMPIHPIVEPVHAEQTPSQPVISQPKTRPALQYPQAVPQMKDRSTPQVITPKHIAKPDAQEMLFKECSGCKRPQPLSEFRENPKQPDGFTKWCITCLEKGAPAPANMQGTKICEKCKQSRRKTSFYPTTKYPDGLSKWCKFCLPKRK